VISVKSNYSIGIKNTSDNSAQGTGSLGKEDFLKLLITELRNQDPLNPIDSKDYIAQLSQFSTLEQMQNINLQLANLSAVNIVGQYVSATDGEREISGLVSGVVFEKSGVSVLIGDEEIKVPMENVFEIRQKG